MQKAIAGTAAKPAATEESLLALIAEAPEDDAPRQVWADWLLERGSKWGELVLAQCELARIERRKGSQDPKWEGAYNAARELRTPPNVAKFMAPIKPYVTDYDFARGLLSRVSASVEKLLLAGAAEAVILRAPQAHLKLQGLKPEHATKLAKMPRGRFASVEVTGKHVPEALAALLSSPLLDGVGELTLWNTTAKAGAALTALPASVRALSLWHAADPDGASEAVLRSSAAKTLEGLFLNGDGKASVEGQKLLRKFPRLKS